jgi:shikimate dehydrogenase
MIKCGIIGYPLKKPRSVKLWKDFFSKKKINSKMLEFNFNKLEFNKKIKKLLIEKEFLASAITMPYKTSIKKYVDVLNETAELSQSVNLIIKFKNKIYGFNTDVYGLLKSLSKNISFKNIIIVGMGGSGNAIYNYINKKYKKNFIIISSKKKKYGKNTKLFRALKYAEILQNKKYLIINCTPLGSNLSRKFIEKTPIENFILNKISKKSYVFDIVYKPKKTKLFYQCKKFKIKYKNGLEMNTFQGKKALDIISKLTNFNLS